MDNGKLAILLKTAWMNAPEWTASMWMDESPNLDMHFESMKPLIDSSSTEELMQFIEDVISYKLAPNGEED